MRLRFAPYTVAGLQMPCHPPVRHLQRSPNCFFGSQLFCECVQAQIALGLPNYLIGKFNILSWNSCLSGRARRANAISDACLSVFSTHRASHTVPCQHSCGHGHVIKSLIGAAGREFRA